jgi:hypothetical protein
VNFECAQYFQAADIIIVQGPKYRKRQILRLMDTSKKGERSMLGPLSGYMPERSERLCLRYRELVVMMQEALFNNGN